MANAILNSHFDFLNTSLMKKLKSLKSGFIENSNFENNRPLVTGNLGQLLYDSSLLLLGAFFFLVDVGPGATVSGKWMEINTR